MIKKLVKSWLDNRRKRIAESRRRFEESEAALNKAWRAERKADEYLDNKYNRLLSKTSLTNSELVQLEALKRRHDIRESRANSNRFSSYGEF